MIVIKDLEITNFKNIKHAHLKGLSHVNVFIGPNNSGKSNLLLAIEKLRGISDRQINSPNFEECAICRELENLSRKQFIDYSWQLSERDAFETTVIPKLFFQFSDEFLESFEDYKKNDIAKIVQGLIDSYKAMNRNLTEKMVEEYVHHMTQYCKNQLDFDNKTLKNKHSSLIPTATMQVINQTVLYCPEERLKNYKGKDISEYIKGKDLDADKLKEVQDSIKEIVDSELKTYTSGSLNYRRGPRKFSTPINEQGSGVRSLICLVFDIISSKEQIVLIDEPELGLNPAAKRKFINFLRNVPNKQFFIATHDPAFVNPRLWDNGQLSIFLYSVTKNEFVKVCLDHNSHDPNTFAGYLPHTTCLKDYHVFVEGTYDVYIHQIFFKKFIDECYDLFKQKQGFASTIQQIQNRVDFYHLGGDFWEHLLHTIPQKPYTALLIFDGDKKAKVRNIIDVFNQNKLGNLPTFKLVEKIDSDLISDSNSIPVYVLAKDNIEQYLNPVPLPENKSQGPDIAKRMVDIPEEFVMLYSSTIGIISPQFLSTLQDLWRSKV
ncbi:MAG: AAA family ATPase [Candidatus Bathyarchaeota archaeon]|nr:AAA family ATPase [Candidatus Bathyarchaeota archaeon]